MPLPNLFRKDDDIQDIIKLFQAEMTEVSRQICELRKENTELRGKIAELEMHRFDDSIVIQKIAGEIDKYVGEVYNIQKEHKQLQGKIAGIELDFHHHEMIDAMDIKLNQMNQQMIEFGKNQGELSVKFNHSEERLLHIESNNYEIIDSVESKLYQTTNDINQINQRIIEFGKNQDELSVKFNHSEERLLHIEDPMAVIKQKFEYKIFAGGLICVKLQDFFDVKYSLFKTPFSLEPDPYLVNWMDVPIRVKNPNQADHERPYLETTFRDYISIRELEWVALNSSGLLIVPKMDYARPLANPHYKDYFIFDEKYENTSHKAGFVFTEKSKNYISNYFNKVKVAPTTLLQLLMPVFFYRNDNHCDWKYSNRSDNHYTYLPFFGRYANQDEL